MYLSNLCMFVYLKLEKFFVGGFANIVNELTYK